MNYLYSAFHLCVCQLHCHLFSHFCPWGHRQTTLCLYGHCCYRNLSIVLLYFRDDKGQLDSAAESKLLGIKINNCLTWNNHMACVKEKIWKQLCLLKRTEKFLSLKARILFYNSIIQPILDYGVVVWGSYNKWHVQDVVKLHKQCTRIILDKKWDTLLRTLLKELNFLPFDARLEYLQNILVFNALNNLAPYYIRAMLRFSLMSFIIWA